MTTPLSCFNDVDWLSANTTISGAIQKSIVFSVSATDGLSSASLQRVIVVVGPSSAPPLSLLLKHTPASDFAREFGLAREALFYKSLSDLCRFSPAFSLPNCYFAEGDVDTGKKTLLLERVVGVQIGAYFGAGSPLNWGKDLEAACAEGITGVDAETVTAAAFAAAAALHASFWRSPCLLEHSWLTRDEVSWNIAQRRAATSWFTSSRALPTDNGVIWNPRLVALVDASLSKTSWAVHEAGDTRARATRGDHFTLLHGDFHPANIIFSLTKKIILLDWEAVRSGSGGAQELGQFVISHMSPSLRRIGERQRVEAYYTALCDACPQVAKDYAFENAWIDYTFGGAERWVWLLALLTGICEPVMVQYFHDQLLAFCDDHKIGSQNIGMPRV